MSRSKRPIDFTKAIFPLATMAAVACVAAPLAREGLEWVAGFGFFALGVLAVFQFIRWRNEEFDRAHAALFRIEPRVPVAAHPADAPDNASELPHSTEPNIPGLASEQLLSAAPVVSICSVSTPSVEQAVTEANAAASPTEVSTAAPAGLGSRTDQRNDLSEHLNPCPKCGAELQLKLVKKGANAGSPYWGCSTYPRCRYRLKILPKAA